MGPTVSSDAADADAHGNPSVTEGPTGAFTYDYSLGMTYPGGSATVSQWAVNWGDGSTPDTLPGNTTADTHQYATGGALT